MVRVIIERKAKEGKELELLGVLLELRTRGMRQPGYVSGETLKGHYNPSLYIVISTWSSAELWHAWTSSPERQRIAQRVEPLLSSPERRTVADFLTE
jgi:heme-degrading monooxygenase HmoA